METISVNKQLLQEDSRGTEKSDTDLARRQESRWLSSEPRIIRSIYVQPNSTHFLIPITCLRLPQCHTSDCKQQKCFYTIFSSLWDPVPQSSFLSASFKISPQSLLLWQVSHSTARKEADIPNFRYSPKLFAFYLPGICRFQNRVFLREQVLSNTFLGKKQTNRQNPKPQHTSLLTDSSI